MTNRLVPHGNLPVRKGDWVTWGLIAKESGLLTCPSDVGLVRHVDRVRIVTVEWPSSDEVIAHYSMIPEEHLLGVYRNQVE